MNSPTKICFKCGVGKPVDEFYRHPAMADGRLNKCKACTKRDVRDNYRANRPQYLQYERGRLHLPHRVEARKQYAKSDVGAAVMRKSRQGYWERNPLKKAAHTATCNAIRDGKLIRQPCEVCGESRAEAHHDDYSKPLDVRWLCKRHHDEWHQNNRSKDAA